MKFSKNEDNDDGANPLTRLIQVMYDDLPIREKVINLLRMDSYRRRFVLNNWLEQLRLGKAPQNLLNALGCLFDDRIAEQVLALMIGNNKPEKMITKNSGGML